MVNNSDKAALLYNSEGIGSNITIENVGGVALKSKETEKLLGLNINSDFVWNTHIEKISNELRKRTGLLKRAQSRLPRNKVLMIAESLWNSVVRYGICIYLTPIYEKEDLKVRKQLADTKLLQVLQNSMLRVVMGLKLEHHTNMEKLREEIKMMSVNQLCIYHTIMEAYNVVRKSSSEQVKEKWEHKNGQSYSLRRKDNLELRVPERARVNCTGFTYHPTEIRNCSEQDTFKSLVKNWIWDHIPSY